MAGMEQEDLEGSSTTEVDNPDKTVEFLNKLFVRECKKCQSIKPPASHHCSTCGYCVARMDHHCPWVNNCVGYNNQKFFLLFLLYVFLGSMHALALILQESVPCLEKTCRLFEPISVVVITILSLFLGLLFGLFVAIMFCDQMSCIVKNTSTIDVL